MGTLGRVHMSSGDSISLISLPPAPELGDAELLVPNAGTYVAIQLDAVHMVKPLDDPELTAAAQRLPIRKYIGYVYHVEELPLPFREDHKCSLELVGRGLCKDNKDIFVDSTMCTPIFPATAHPLSRESLRPIPSFPFPDCYQYTAPVPVVRIPTGGYKLSKAVSLGSRDFMVDSLYVDEDRTRRRARRVAKAASQAHMTGSGSLVSPSVTHPSVPRASSVDVPAVPSVDANSSRQARQNASAARCQVWAEAVANSSTVTSVPDELPLVEAGEVTTLASDQCLPDQAASLVRDTPRSPTAPSRLGPEASRHEDEAAVNSDVNAYARGRSKPPSLHTPSLAPEDEAEDDVALDQHPDDASTDSGSSAEDLIQMFVDPFPGEDRIAIPLVRASLDLSEVDEVNDPALFLEEVKQIKQLIEESRSRSASLRSRSHSRLRSLVSGHEGSACGSWVDLALELDSASAEIASSRKEACKFHRIRFGAGSALRRHARWTQSHCTAFLRKAKALATFYATSHGPTTLPTH